MADGNKGENIYGSDASVQKISKKAKKIEKSPTPVYTGNVLSELVNISDDGKGNINHDTLPKFAQVEFEIPLIDKEYEVEKKNEQMGER